jgi:transcription antitermination factor NusG
MHGEAVRFETPESDRSLVSWYAVYTKHQHERVASDLLARKGFEVFLPLYRATHRWKDRNKVISLPVFPCYLFLRTLLDRKVEILRTPGVFWLVESAGHACPIPEHEIEAIRKAIRSSADLEPHPYLKCGDLVRVRGGVLSGIEGSLVQMKSRYRVVLSVHLLQRSVAVEVDLSMVERINPSSSVAVPPGYEETRLARQVR